MADYEEVERPEVHRRIGIAAAVRRTVETGKAIRILMKDRASHAVEAARFRREGLVVHQHREGDYLIIWAEQIEPTNGATP